MLHPFCAIAASWMRRRGSDRSTEFKDQSGDSLDREEQTMVRLCAIAMTFVILAVITGANAAERRRDERT
jgi:hypothetical protein